jgi:hypothetical protein
LKCGHDVSSVSRVGGFVGVCLLWFGIVDAKDGDGRAMLISFLRLSELIVFEDLDGSFSVDGIIVFFPH